MKRSLSVAFVIALGVIGSALTWADDHSARRSGFSVKLPIPDYNIQCDLSLWKGSFQIVKMSYDADQGQVVFVLRAARDFTFKDDGFETIQFLDEDGVDMINAKNLKFTPQPRDLKKGESTRALLEVPADDVLKKTKSARAQAKGFFQK